MGFAGYGASPRRRQIPEGMKTKSSVGASRNIAGWTAAHLSGDLFVIMSLKPPTPLRLICFFNQSEKQPACPKEKNPKHPLWMECLEERQKNGNLNGWGMNGPEDPSCLINWRNCPMDVLDTEYQAQPTSILRALENKNKSAELMTPHPTRFWGENIRLPLHSVAVLDFSDYKMHPPKSGRKMGVHLIVQIRMQLTWLGQGVVAVEQGHRRQEQDHIFCFKIFSLFSSSKTQCILWTGVSYSLKNMVSK